MLTRPWKGPSIRLPLEDEGDMFGWGVDVARQCSKSQRPKANDP